MSNISVQDWDRRNVWPLHSGELAVRPGLVKIYTPVSGRNLIGGFSIKSSVTDAVWHYLFDYSTTGAVDVIMRIVDENFVTIQAYSMLLNVIPRTITYAILEDELIISSPDFPTIWGLVGGSITRAEEVASVNPNTTAIAVPKGLCVSWGGRVVIADDDAMYFSDALAPRTYVGENALNPPGGSIFGLHVTAEGALVVATASGVFALPEDAAASGQLVVGIFTKLTDYECIDYQTSAVSQGRCYGLTKKGFRIIDTSGNEEVLLDEDMVNRTASGGRIAFPDYRDGKLFSGTFGPIASINRFTYMVDLATGLKSWWHCEVASHLLRLKGLLYENDGAELYIIPEGILRLLGNVEITGTNQVKAFIAGRMETPPNASPVIRRVQFASDTGVSIGCSVNGTTKTSVPPQVDPVVGTDVWGSGTWRDPPLRSRELNFSCRTDDVQLELQVTDHPARIPLICDVIFRGPGKERPD